MKDFILGFLCALAIQVSAATIEIPDPILLQCEAMGGCMLVPAEVLEKLVNVAEKCGMGFKGTSWQTSKTF